MKISRLCLSLLFAALPLQAQAPNPAPVPPAPEVHAGTFFSPRMDTRGEVLRLIRQATRSLTINMYSFTDMSIEDALLEAADRGVEIKMLIDAAESRVPQNRWRTLVQARHPNLKLYLTVNLRGPEPSSHNKFMIADGKDILTGSTNFSTFGFFGAYDSTISTDDLSLIGKFQAEFDEMWGQSDIFCRRLADDAALCQTGGENYRYAYYDLLVNGKIGNTLTHRTDVCKAVLKGPGIIGLLDRFNRLNTPITTCVRDQKLLDTLSELAEVDRFADGKRISQVCLDQAAELAANGSPAAPCDLKRYRSAQAADQTRVYFSPEDNPAYEISRLVYQASLTGSQSLLLISSNYISDRYLQRGLMEARNRGLPITILMDKYREQEFDAEDAAFLQNIQVLAADAPPTAAPAKLHWVTALFTGYDFVQNHHRFALVYNDYLKQTALITGSANWTVRGSMGNDENTIITTHPQLVKDYASEFLSQLLTYGYQGQSGDAGFLQQLGRLKEVLAVPGFLEGCTSASSCAQKFMVTLEGLTFAQGFGSVWSVAARDKQGVWHRFPFQQITEQKQIAWMTLEAGDVQEFRLEQTAVSDGSLTSEKILSKSFFPALEIPDLYRVVKLDYEQLP